MDVIVLFVCIVHSFSMKQLGIPSKLTYRAANQHSVVGLRRRFLPIHLTSCRDDVHMELMWSTRLGLLRFFQGVWFMDVFCELSRTPGDS